MCKLMNICTLTIFAVAIMKYEMEMELSEEVFPFFMHHVALKLKKFICNFFFLLCRYVCTCMQWLCYELYVYSHYTSLERAVAAVEKEKHNNNNDLNIVHTAQERILIQNCITVHLLMHKLTIWFRAMHITIIANRLRREKLYS